MMPFHAMRLRNSGVAGGDPYFSFVKGLLHFEGADASTTYTDVTGKTWTGAGNAQIDTAQFKYGASSLLLDGTGDYVDGPSSADWTFGTGDFVVEAWVRRGGTGTNDFIFGWGTWGVYFGANNLFTWNGASNVHSFNTGSSSVGVWRHGALSRRGTDLRLYLDFSRVANSTDSTNHSTTSFRIGDTVSGIGPFIGHIDEVRITKGSNRGYTGPSLTAITGPFPDF
jgi:hypothetical protein